MVSKGEDLDRKLSSKRRNNDLFTMLQEIDFYQNGGKITLLHYVGWVACSILRTNPRYFFRVEPT